jgi:flagellar basal body-associated protein FliL
MNKIDEVLELLKQRERESEKPKNVILWVLAIVGAVAAVAGIAYAVYRFVTPDYLEDFEDDFDDDFDDRPRRRRSDRDYDDRDDRGR